jgi:hypothetical protein
MKNIKTHKSILAGAALAGIIAGGFAAKTTAADTSAPQFKKSELGTNASQLADEKKEKGDTHSCAGKNGCKGKGGCKTGDNGCAGKNSCKGKGGCAMKDGKPAHPKK